MPAKGWSCSKYNDKMPAQLIEMFSRGKDRCHFCSAHFINNDTFDEWLKKHAEFREAYETAKQLGKKWYMDVAQEHLVEHPDGDKLNTTLWSMIMRNRFELTETRKLKAKALASAKTGLGRMQNIMSMLERGEITALEATQLSKVVEVSMAAQDHDELEKRITQIEAAQASGVTDSGFKEI